MSAPLTLMRLKPDLAAVARWALPKSYLPRGVDHGYALHAALKAALGDFAPKPFVLRDNAKGSVPEILGYTTASPDTLLEAATLPGVNDEAASSALGVSGLVARAMPDNWSAGRKLSFELRARPIVRSRAHPRTGKSDEVDIAAWEAERARPAIPEAKADIYLRWVAAQFSENDAASRCVCELAALRQTRVVRRRSNGANGGGRVGSIISGPDILVRGLIEVGNPDAFAALIARGVGRHRAFGFGCVLLAPPGAL